jgi:hypothetical protein
MDGNTAYGERLCKVDKLLREENAPTYAHIASEIGCCEHTAEKFINDLREKLAPWRIYIIHDKNANSYVYTGAGRSINIFLWIADENEEIFKKHFSPKHKNTNPPIEG